MAQHIGRELHQCIDFNFLFNTRHRPGQRRKFERTHAARADITQPLDSIEIRGCAALRGEPGVDQRIAKFIRQRIGQSEF